MEPLCSTGVCPPFRTTAKENVAARRTPFKFLNQLGQGNPGF